MADALAWDSVGKKSQGTTTMAATIVDREPGARSELVEPEVAPESAVGRERAPAGHGAGTVGSRKGEIDRELRPGDPADLVIRAQVRELRSGAPDSVGASRSGSEHLQMRR